MLKTVVLDADGVVFALNESVEKVVCLKYPSFSFSKARTYGLNKDLSCELKKKAGICEADPWYGMGAPREYIYTKYASVDSYRNSVMYDIPRLAELCNKCNVVFHTAGSAVDVCKFKIAQLNGLLDRLGVTACVSVQLTGNMVFLNLGDGSEPLAVKDRLSVDKPALVCDYAVEDSIENLAGYVNCKRFLVDKPYNSEEYNPHFAGVFSRTTRVSSLNEAIDIILEEV